MTSPAWNAQVDHLAAWMRGNPGRLPRSQSHTTTTNPAEKKVGIFLSNQRIYKKKLDAGAVEPGGMTAARVATLDARCPGWSIETDFWAEGVDNLSAWMRKNPGRLPSIGSADPSEKKVGKFMTAQRGFKKKLDGGGAMRMELKGMTAERAAMLDARCPGWDADAWAESVDGLADWICAAGPGRLPSIGSADPAEEKAGKFLLVQRLGKKKLDDGAAIIGLRGMTTERAATLDVRCPGWDRKWDSWAMGVDGLAAWMRAAGPGQLPSQVSADPAEKKAGTFLAVQRKNKKKLDGGATTARELGGMTAARVATLNTNCPGWSAGVGAALVVEEEEDDVMDLDH